MAQGRNSLKFIALMARRGWGDDSIRAMYNYALRNNHLSSPSRERWLKAEEWWHGEQSSDSRSSN